MSVSAIIADEGDTQATSKVVDADLFIQRLAQLRRITFTAGEAAPEKGVKRLTLHCKPQGIYHKNFSVRGVETAKCRRCVLRSRGEGVPVVAACGKGVRFSIMCGGGYPAACRNLPS